MKLDLLCGPKPHVGKLLALRLEQIRLWLEPKWLRIYPGIFWYSMVWYVIVYFLSQQQNVKLVWLPYLILMKKF